MLRTRTEIMEIILKDKTLKTLFDSWETEFQEEFLNICTGISGVKVLLSLIHISSSLAVNQNNTFENYLIPDPEL